MISFDDGNCSLLVVRIIVACAECRAPPCISCLMTVVRNIQHSNE